MTNSIVRFAPDLAAKRTGSFAARLARAALLRLGPHLVDCELTLVDPDGTHHFGSPCRDGLRATIQVRDLAFYSYVAFRGSIGAGEAYVLGLWESDDLLSVMRIFARNAATLDKMDSGFSRLTEPVYRIAHALRRNTVAGSKKNILAHYDLGNEFYELLLDETLSYSAGIFERSDSTLRDASINKIDRICRKLDLRSTDHLVEIGTGWGGLSIYAASEFGCRVTTTTISQEQYELAKERIERAGLADRVEVLLEDYRNLRGQYDKLVSVEMIEAVGFEYFSDYFGACSRLLRPDGAMLLQSITIGDQSYDSAKRSVDFIKQYIFPGSCIPSVSAIADAVARSTDMRIVHLEDITSHYARTVHEWRSNFWKNRQMIAKLGYPGKFLRMWDYYLALCEGGFSERYIGNVQLLIHKRGRPKVPSVSPLTTDD